jgi:hypothetical protein
MEWKRRPVRVDERSVGGGGQGLLLFFPLAWEAALREGPLMRMVMQ